MKFNLKPIVFGLMLCSNGFAYDCGPKTLTTLSYLVNKPIKEEVWLKSFFPNNETETPELGTILLKWKENVPTVDLVVVYSAFKSQIGKTITMEGNVPHLWVGVPSAETANPDEKGTLHSGICYFFKDRVCIVTTVATRDIYGTPAFDFFIETTNISHFFMRTAILFKPINTDDKPLVARPISDFIPLFKQDKR
jgi:hypothetical protein